MIIIITNDKYRGILIFYPVKVLLSSQLFHNVDNFEFEKCIIDRQSVCVIVLSLYLDMGR